MPQLQSAATAHSGAVILAFARPMASETPSEATIHFTWRDRIDLAQWASSARFARIVIEHGQPDAGPDRAPFALIYTYGSQWSRWGLTRTEEGIVTWCCRTGTDHPPQSTVAAALNQLPNPSCSG